jgi:hypothetical protein
VFSPLSGDEIAITKSTFIEAWNGNALSLLPFHKPWDQNNVKEHSIY